MYQKPAVCTSLFDGTCQAVLMPLLGEAIVWVSEQPDGSVTRRPFQLGGPAHDIKIAVDGRGRRWIVTSESGAGVLYAVDFTMERIVVQPSGVGSGFINVRPLATGGCEVLIPQPGGGVNVWSVTGLVVGPVFEELRPMSYASEGLHHFEQDDGTCVSEDQARGPIDLPGGRMFRLETHDGMTLGQLSDGFGQGVGILRNGVVERVAGIGYTNQSSHFVVSAITWRVWVAAPGEDTPDPSTTVLEPLVVTPLEELPALPTALPAMLTGYLGGDATSPGMLGGTGSGKPVLIEGFHQDGSPWLLPTEEARCRIVFVDPQESHAPDVERANALALQDRTGAWLGWYCDRPQMTDDVLVQARATQAAGRPTLLILRAYPTGPDDFAEAVAARVQADIDRYRHEFALAICAPAYDQSGFWSRVDAQLVRKTLRALARVLEANPGVVKALVFFGWKRPPAIPEIENDAAAMCAAVGAVDVDQLLPRRWPAPRPAPPVPTDPPAPPSIPAGDHARPRPTPLPPARHEKSAPVGKVAAGIGIFAAMIAWLRRKR